LKKYIYTLPLEMASPGNQHCANQLYQHTFVPHKPHKNEKAEALQQMSCLQSASSQTMPNSICA